MHFSNLSLSCCWLRSHISLKKSLSSSCTLRLFPFPRLPEVLALFVTLRAAWRALFRSRWGSGSCSLSEDVEPVGGGIGALDSLDLTEPFSPHGRGLVTIVYVVKRSFQFDMKQDTCHVKGRKFTCKVWRTSWKRALNLIYSQCCEEDGIGLNHRRRRKY